MNDTVTDVMIFISRATYLLITKLSPCVRTYLNSYCNSIYLFIYYHLIFKL